MSKETENIRINIARDIRSIRDLIIWIFVLWIFGGFIKFLMAIVI